MAARHKAMIAFGLGAQEDAAVLSATDEVVIDTMSAGLNAEFREPEFKKNPEHGIWVWEGVLESVEVEDDIAPHSVLRPRGVYRLPTTKEWAALRENRSPFEEYVKVGPVETFAVLTDEMKAKGRWWVSWWGKIGFGLHLPWWITGGSEGEDHCICAAILADSEKEARAAVIGAHDDNGAGISEWRFVEPRTVDWQPFCDRFPRAGWMQWPAEYAAP